MLLFQLLKTQAQAQEEIPRLRALRMEFRTLAAGIGDPSDYYGDGETLYAHEDAVPKQVDYVFTVNGNSMEPDFHSGDMVLVRQCLSGKLRPGQIGAFMWDN